MLSHPEPILSDTDDHTTLSSSSSPPSALATTVALTSSSPSTTSSSSSTIHHPTKRGREPSSMTDPSEAARYKTPPREMFLKPGPEEASVPYQDSLMLDPPSSSIPFDSAKDTLLPSIPADSELDTLGHQLSIHSPEKSVLSTVDQEPKQDVADLGPQLDESTPKTEQTPSTPSAPPPFEQQASLIKELGHQRLEEGDSWYLIDKTWMVSFRRYCARMAEGREGAAHPGEIDNSQLLVGDTLRPDIGASVVTTPQQGWDLLVSWYGSATAPIKRTVVNTGSDLAPNYIIDYYPPVFTFYRVVDSSQAVNPMFAMNEPETIQVTRSTKFSDLKAALLSRFGLSAPCRLWAIPANASLSVEGNAIGSDAMADSGAICLEHIEDEATIAEITELSTNKDIALEIATEDGYLVPTVTPAVSFPTNLSPAISRSLYGPRSVAASSALSSAAEGICGLQNLGNTCFMNSALQCLSNTPDLTRYILAGAWRDELNLDNPLGMSGEVARAYANLIEKLWNGTSKVFSPRDFKSTIGRFAPSFTGYHQHDSQELLAFLLDGLHEDLNRIIKKPYTEVPDSNGRPDEEVASDCWNIHKARNDSIIVDLFQGQYKSTLVCPECEKVSVTFDPFMYLSLPLPINKKWVGTITYVPYDPSKPVVDIRLQLPKGSTQRQLKEKIAAMMGTDASRLFSAEVFSHRLYKSHDNSDAVDEMGESDKNFMYELPVADFTTNPDHVTFPVFHLMAQHNSYSARSTAFGHPIFVSVTKEEARDPDAVYNAIVQQANRYTTADLYEDPAPAQTLDSIEAEGTDSAMSPEGRVPIKGLFETRAYMPSNSFSRMRSIARPSLYAPSGAPMWSDMVDIFKRARPEEPESLQEMSGYNSPRDTAMEDDERMSEGNLLMRATSPSSLSDSSRSSGRPLVPRPDADELSEEDDPAVLKYQARKRSPHYEREIETLERRAVAAEPAVQPGEMIFCTWNASLEKSLVERRPARAVYSSRYAEDEDESPSDLRPLWDERGEPVMDPLLQEELLTAKQGKKVITLEDCLSEYTREEQLGEEDLWYCPNCKKHQQATKKLDIWRLPDILVVHLKRFSHTRAWRDKIDALVDFPIHGLDLSGKALKEDEEDENVYDLFGVSNHMGGLGGGHYTAYAKNEKLNQWFNFDDSHVSPVNNIDSIKSSSAYLLFYRRRNAPVRQYEQRAAEVVSPKFVGGHRLGLGPNHHSGFMSIQSSSRHQDNDDEEYGPWGKPGPVDVDDFQGLTTLGHGPDDSEDELPPYNSHMGPSGLIGPSSSFSGPLTFLSGRRRGKGKKVEDGLADNYSTDMMSMSMTMDEEDDIGRYHRASLDSEAHSPDVSTCASDGSNPGTANVSPGLSPMSLGATVSSYPPMDLSSIGSPLLASGEHVGEPEYESLPSYEGLESGAGMPTPSSTVFETAGDETEGEDGDQDGVNLVQWSSSGHGV